MAIVPTCPLPALWSPAMDLGFALAPFALAVVELALAALVPEPGEMLVLAPPWCCPCPTRGCRYLVWWWEDEEVEQGPL